MGRYIYAQRGLRGALVGRHNIELGQNDSNVTNANPNELQRKEGDFDGEDVGIAAARASKASMIGREGDNPAGTRRQGTCTLHNNVKGCVADVFRCARDVVQYVWPGALQGVIAGLGQGGITTHTPERTLGKSEGQLAVGEVSPHTIILGE